MGSADLPGLLTKVMLTLSVSGRGGGRTPEALRKGQWRSDEAVVLGFQLEFFHAAAVFSDDRLQ